MNKLSSSSEIIQELHTLANPEKVAFKASKFGIVTTQTLGIYQKDINELIRRIQKSDELALELYDSGIYEAKILCGKMFKAKNLTDELAERWISEFDNWEICDTFCMGIIAKSPLALDKIYEWSTRESEFEKRAAFATMAAYCMADKKAHNEIFESFLPIIQKEAWDKRNFVKKAINWALRSIGKRNIDLNQKAIKCANEILLQPNAVKWIATDAIKELTKEHVRMSDYPREVYRPT